MTRRLANVSSAKAHKALQRLGFTDAHRQGSHQTMVRHRDGGVDIVVLVMGKREINPFTLTGALRAGNVTIDDFAANL